MRRYRWAIVGVGRMAYEMGATLKNHPQVELYAVCSRSLANAKRYAAEFGIPRAYNDPASLMDDERVEVIYIATPNHTHASLVLLAISAGKHVLCEKPLGVNADEVRCIARAQTQSHSVIMEGLWTRFLPVFSEIRGLLGQGVIGRPIAYEASFGLSIPYEPTSRIYDQGQGGGVLLDLGVYPFSLALCLFGDFSSVSASLDYAASGVEDEARIEATHVKEVVGDIKVSFKRDLRNDLIIYGTEGRIEVAPPLYRPARYRVVPYKKRSMLPSSHRSMSLFSGTRGQISEALFSLKEKARRLISTVFHPGWRTVPYRGSGYGHQIDALLAAIAQKHAMVEGLTLIESQKVLHIIDQCRKKEQFSCSIPRLQ